MTALNPLINLFLLNQLENADGIYRERIERGLLRASSDPFAMTNKSFLKTYRLTKNMVFYLIDELGPYMRDQQRVTAVPIQIKILVALYFFGYGSYQACVGQNFHLGVKQPTVSIILTEVTDVLVEHFLDVWVAFPKEENKILPKTNLPGVIGAIDGSHVAIISPPKEHPIYPAHAYYNRKGFYSINVQVVTDFNLKILNCLARFPGSSHDSGIWRLSAVKRHMQNKYIMERLQNYWLIGDSGYPLQPWLLTPVDNAEDNTPDSRYTNAHIIARNCVERCFGALKSRFICLLKHRTLNYDPVKAGKIIYSCAILHNMAVEMRLPLPEDDIDEQALFAADRLQDQELVDQNHPVEDINWLAEGRRVRDNVIQHFV